MRNKWLVVSFCTGDLGTWLFDSRKDAIARKREIEQESDCVDQGNVDLWKD